MLKLLSLPAWFALLLLSVSAQTPAKPTIPAVTPAATPAKASATPSAIPAPVTQAASASPVLKTGLTPFGGQWVTKTFDVKYADPERLKSIFAGRSFVMEASPELKVLTAHGSPEFLQEVEDTIKRFDIPPPPPANLQINIYLLTALTQAPLGVALPAELTALAKELTASGAPALVLADLQMMRMREGEPGEQASAPGTPEAPAIARVHLKGAVVEAGNKSSVISLNGLQIWLTMPPAAGSPVQSRTDADISSDIDVDQNTPVIVSKAGVNKPVIVVVRAAIAK